MLTADLVRVRRRGGELRLVPLDQQGRARAEALATLYLEVARDCIGRARADLDEALDRVEVAAGEQRVAGGLMKLIEDRCDFDSASAGDPETLRRKLFLRATEVRRSLAAGAKFDRTALLSELASAEGIAPAELERRLYSDLRAAHVLRATPGIAPAALVDHYDLAQAQAVLLRAVKVVVEVKCGSAGAYRALFRKLKFLRLLHTIQKSKKLDYRVEIDGPLSLFDAGTKYGLQLALLVPALGACDRFELAAELRWGKSGDRLTFHLDGGRSGDDATPTRPPDEVVALLDGIRALDTPWIASTAAALLELPGVGLCVPDLLFTHRETGEKIHLEVLGYWSREAVWRRVELVEKGLRERILFAVSERLRVSEAALDGELLGALYVYKGAMSARAVLERLDRLRVKGFSR